MNLWLIGAGAVCFLIMAGVEFVLYTKNKKKVSLFSACTYLVLGVLFGIGVLDSAGIIDLGWHVWQK